jgi:hypothetical protein
VLWENPYMVVIQGPARVTRSSSQAPRTRTPAATMTMTRMRTRSATTTTHVEQGPPSSYPTTPVAAAGGTRSTRASPRFRRGGGATTSTTTPGTTSDGLTSGQGSRPARGSGTPDDSPSPTSSPPSGNDGSSRINDRIVWLVSGDGPGDGDDDDGTGSDNDDSLFNETESEYSFSDADSTMQTRRHGTGHDDDGDESSGGSSSDSDYNPSDPSGDDDGNDGSDEGDENDDDEDNDDGADSGDDDDAGRRSRRRGDPTAPWMREAMANGWIPSSQQPLSMAPATIAPTTPSTGNARSVPTAAETTKPMTAAQRRRLLKDMEFPEYHPSPDMPVETWIGSVEGILEELDDMTREGGPVFKPKQLFNTIGSKVRTPGGVRWFNNLRANLPSDDKTPTELFSRLRERFGRPDSDVRVRIRLGKRKWQPGERYHDYAGQLRRMAEGSGVGDLELLQYFLEGIDLHTSNIVQLREPTTLADGARMATVHGVEEWNVARGMQLLGREWPMPPHPEPLIAAAASAAVASANAATGQGADIGSAMVGTEVAPPLYGPGPMDPVLSNPNGVFNYWTGRYERPPDRAFRGGMWVPTHPVAADQNGTVGLQPQPATTERIDSHDTASGRGRNASDGSGESRGKRARVLVGHGRDQSAVEDEQSNKRARPNVDAQYLDKDGRLICYACQQEGHTAKYCPDSAAKARNDEKLNRRFVGEQQAVFDSIRETRPYQQQQQQRLLPRLVPPATRPQQPPQGNGGRL